MLAGFSGRDWPPSPAAAADSLVDHGPMGPAFQNLLSASGASGVAAAPDLPWEPASWVRDAALQLACRSRGVVPVGVDRVWRVDSPATGERCSVLLTPIALVIRGADRRLLEVLEGLRLRAPG